jgi:hypothetical protein
MAIESTQTQLRSLEVTQKERNEQGTPLNESEQKEFNQKKEHLQKGHADAKRYSETFRRSQEHSRKVAAQGLGVPKELKNQVVS